jgi:hypothetical protein
LDDYQQYLKYRKPPGSGYAQKANKKNVWVPTEDGGYQPAVVVDENDPNVTVVQLAKDESVRGPFELEGGRQTPLWRRDLSSPPIPSQRLPSLPGEDLREGQGPRHEPRQVRRCWCGSSRLSSSLTDFKAFDVSPSVTFVPRPLLLPLLIVFVSFVSYLSSQRTALSLVTSLRPPCSTT